MMILLNSRATYSPELRAAMSHRYNRDNVERAFGFDDAVKLVVGETAFIREDATASAAYTARSRDEVEATDWDATPVARSSV